MTQDLNHMKTDVALIKKDIKNIEQFFSKFDYIVEMTAERDKTVSYTHLTLPTTPYV